MLKPLLLKLEKLYFNFLFFFTLALLKCHFLFLLLFRPSRAFSVLFTTRLAKMADAQVRSAERRGEIKTINPPDCELFGATGLDTFTRSWFI